jgi:hypothetical protein
MRTYAAQGSVSARSLGRQPTDCRASPESATLGESNIAALRAYGQSASRTRNGSPAARHTTSRGPARARHPTRIKSCLQGAVSSLPLTDHIYEKIL